MTQTTLTQKQINEIAAATKRICSRDGYGHQVIVWADGGWSEATSGNDTIARGSGDGREAPVARLRQPMTRAEVRESLEGHEWSNPVRCTACGETCEHEDAKHYEGYVYCPACVAADPEIAAL